ncbi:hypothetical protein CAQU_03325 [Corynebacterium aquilae DSM 44791]|uniref:Uncharacterized protein n=2 Tax=Corynebacterium aquilae TaxID=203263 RepID=A0A1L7CEL7_9CORY|nr:hypothetical protein CAQU_03325 [Corynebacterium aquilae DSM 44791]
MMRAVIPAPWRVIVALLVSGTLVMGVLDGVSFGVPGVDDEVYFTIAEWWMYAATIAAIGVCVPRLRAVDLGCRRARLATFVQGLVTALMALACAGMGAAVVNMRRTVRSASYIEIVIPPGSEYVVVATLTAAGLALGLVTLFGATVGTALSLVAVVAIALVNLVVPEGFPLPIPPQPFQGTWWQPVSVVESLVIFLLGLSLWGKFGGALARGETSG